MTNRFKNPALRKAYDMAVACYEAKHADLFLPDGSRHLGSAQAKRFWVGYDGIGGDQFVGDAKTTFAYAFWRAGRDMAARTDPTAGPGPKLGRKPVTGRFETRAELCEAIWDGYDFETVTLGVIARRCGVSGAVANKIINTGEGRPDRTGYTSTVINVPGSARSVTVLRKPEELSRG